MNRLRFKSLVICLLCLLPSAATAAAVDPPHGPANGYTCATCHTLHRDLGSTGYNNICLGCHYPGVPKGGKKPFTAADYANPFNTYTTARPGTLYQTSHNWNGPDTNPAAGAQPPLFATMAGSSLRAGTGGNLACVRCHNPHDNTFKPFLRMANDRDQMCLDCHRSRDKRSHTAGTHPVNFSYTGATSRVRTNPAEYNNPPLNANPANPTSDLNAGLSRTGGALVCSTCHGVHYTDSDSATFDNHSGYNSLKPSDGSLLRTDLRGKSANDVNICSNCHAGKVAHNSRGQNIQCADCHGGHVDFDPNAVTTQQKNPNVWLVRRYMNISTPLRSAKKIPIYFQSALTKNYKDAGGNGVCQSCHDVPVGVGYPVEHASLDTSVCNDCHFHNNASGSFSAIGACNTCHGYPPQADTAGDPRGYAVFNGTPSPFTNESVSGHLNHAAGPYSRQCIECHQGNSHRSGTFQDVFLDTAGLIASSFGAVPAFNGTIPTAPTCSNVYCHSDGAPRNASLVPVLTTKTIPAWANGRGAIVGQPDECRRCHGDATTLATNSHSRHLAGSIGCIVCHSTTVGSNSSIKNFNAHVNGVKDIRFSSFTSAGRSAWSGSTAVCAAVYCHSNVQGTIGNGAPSSYASPVWGSAPLACGSCHVDMSLSASATGSHIKHAQFSGIGCTTCHNGAVAVAPLHADGIIEISFSGPAATGTSYSQANLPAGNGYGVCATSYCHSNVQGADGTGGPTRSGTPAWGGVFPCGSCHVQMNTDASASGSHVLHANTTGGGKGSYPCSTCHYGAGSGTTNHTNHGIDLAFTAPANPATVYSLGNSVPPGSGYGNCANTTCHGEGTPTWGANSARPTCEKCHGSAATVPFYATSGNSTNTDPRAGAHTNHLNASAAGHAFSSNLSCSECHRLPADVNAAGHMDTTLPADIAFGTLAGTGGLTPAYNAGTGVCTNVYCHGAKMSGGDASGTNRAPTWNVAFLPPTITRAACGSCHGFPPLPASGHPDIAIPAGFPATAPIGTACSCHANINTAGNSYANIFVNKALHINGALEVLAGGACDSCHGYPPAMTGFVGTQGNWIGARAEDYPGGGGAHTIAPHVSRSARPADGFANCDKCHDPGDHRMSPLMFLPGTNIRVRINSSLAFEPAKQVRYSSNRLNGSLHITGTCSNIDCHIGATPKWDPLR
jgi:predicted CxxxxCH...CXXCH cytochrome family protein